MLLKKNIELVEHNALHDLSYKDDSFPFHHNF